jgi:hypothetical protein
MAEIPGNGFLMGQSIIYKWGISIAMFDYLSILSEGRFLFSGVGV